MGDIFRRLSANGYQSCHQVTEQFGTGVSFCCIARSKHTPTAPPFNTTCSTGRYTLANFLGSVHNGHRMQPGGWSK